MTGVRQRERARIARRLAAVCAVAALAAVAVFGVSPRWPWHDFFDLHVYRGAVRWWLDGRPLYQFLLGSTPYGFTYPPFAAVALLPLALVAQQVAEVAMLAVSGLLVVALTAWLVAPLARRHGWPRWFAAALAVPVVLALEPVRETLGYGQLNVVLLALVLADLVGLRRGARWAGAGIGLATAVKLTPGLFVVYLLLTRRLRAAAVAGATFLAATAVGFAVDTRGSWTYWTHALWETGRVGALASVSNTSLMGVLARATPGERPSAGLWLVLVAVVLTAALWRALRAWQAGDDLVGFTLVGLAACLASPITWTHHLTWLVPALAVLVDVAAGTPPSTATPQLLRRPRAARATAGLLALAVLLVFGLSLMWIGVPPPNTPGRDTSGVLHSDLYAVVLVALVALLPVRAMTSSACRPTPRPGAVPDRR
ncbi:glycosyltransferase 87 family protein [Geodermatophilus sp. TF02-6]|uniref:glycosyltransferase 87 family protein n=1 Tax=Geodermatophilus sp. TF02-6 TaxID=2250575 RepID=UPI000DEAB5E2|nr:glycosyltransferase 87 family protein [Geodermatophilus sp. TF02-6]